MERINALPFFRMIAWGSIVRVFAMCIGVKMEKELLPIGTIVLLKKATKRLMITGYFPTSDAKPGYVWDYSGFLFPEGYRNQNEVYQFDREQIDKVFAMGYQDEEQLAFIEKAKEAEATVKANNADAE